jgi:hypothetical protein
MRSAAWIAAALAGVALAAPAPASALVTPAVTVAGPSTEIVDFGGVAMASDGGGGLVYTKAVEGVPHVFVSRYDEGRWGAPIRVDWDQPFDASQPRIAAGPKGELLVVWVTQIATVHKQIRYALYSASLGPRASAFGPSQLVDPDVGEGIGVDPSISATAPGQAIVAYRVITYDFDGTKFSTAVQLRPGDVLADIRVARLKEDRWSSAGTINRNPEASMRPPSATNGPQVLASADGSAAVAWQEPDQTGTARIWLRRVFGTTPGPVLEASPASWEGRPVTADADAFSLAISAFAQVRVAIRIAPAAGSVLGGRLLLNSLQPNFSLTAGTPTGPLIADGGSAGAIGVPGVAASDEGGGEGAMRLGFLAGSDLHLIGVDNNGALTAVPTPAGPPGLPGAQVVTAVDSEGGGVVAYPAADSRGRPAVAVRQEFPSGAAQTALLSGVESGPLAELAIGLSGGGDGLIGFREGEPGHFQVVGARVSAPPAKLQLEAPPRWLKPARLKLHWTAPRSAAEVRYSVLVGGRVVKRGLRRRFFHPPSAALGNGVRAIRVLATDSFGQQVLSKPVKVRVDGQPPLVRIEVHRGHGSVSVRIRDTDSGPKGKAELVAFGDGSVARGGTKFHHAYERGGRYTVLVRAGDRAGNRILRRFGARVR